MGADAGLAGVAQLVEHQPSKLRVAGSSPVARLRTEGAVARVAQLVERILGKDEVSGSIPLASFWLLVTSRWFLVTSNQ